MCIFFVFLFCFKCESISDKEIYQLFLELGSEQPFALIRIKETFELILKLKVSEIRKDGRVRREKRRGKGVMKNLGPPKLLQARNNRVPAPSAKHPESLCTLLCINRFSFGRF